MQGGLAGLTDSRTTTIGRAPSNRQSAQRTDPQTETHPSRNRLRPSHAVPVCLAGERVGD
jgi:hypothetical protein